MLLYVSYSQLKVKTNLKASMWKKCAPIVPPMNTSVWKRMEIAVKSTGKCTLAQSQGIKTRAQSDDVNGDIVSQSTIFIAPTP